MGVLAWIAIGFIAGFVGRAVVRPGRRLGCTGTIAVGLIGSLVGGTIGNILTGDGFDLSASGIGGSILGTVLVLALVRAKNPPQRRAITIMRIDPHNGPPPPWKQP